MHRIRPVIVLLLAVMLPLSPALAAPKAAAKAEAARLRIAIDEILSRPEIARGLWGVDVISLTTGKTLYSVNDDKLFVPASDTKLFTTAAAFALIGSSYRFLTTVETTGTLDKYGRLNGDLALVGRGDPFLSGRNLPYNMKTERTLPPLGALQDLADQLVQKGVKFVDGNVIGDDSYYAFERYGEGWSQDDMVWEWGAPVSALTINDNVVFANILPGDRSGDKAFVNLTPYADYYRLDNRILTTPPGTGPRRIYVTREPGSMALTLWGTIPLDDPGASEGLAIEDPAQFAAQAFRQMLEQRGIVVYGNARTRHADLANLSTFSVTTVAPAVPGGGDIPARTAPAQQNLVLASHESPPLLEDLQVTNKVSQNLHAELLLRLLGREKGTAGTVEGGSEVVRGFLAKAGINPDEYAFFDGSGLSRENLVTPNAILKLLIYAAGQPWGNDYRNTLPVAGTDGSLAERFKGSPAEGRVFGKTGSLGHVNTLSGYADTLGGDHVVFAIMVNNHNLTNRVALQAIDQIVDAIVSDVARKK